MHNLLSIFSASSPHQIKITLPPCFLLSAVILGTHEASTQFAISLHYFSFVCPVSSTYLTSFYSSLVHQHGMFSPLHFSFTQTNSLKFFSSPAMHSRRVLWLQKTILLEVLWAQLLEDKNLPSWLRSVIVIGQQWPKITRIRKLPLEVQY